MNIIRRKTTHTPMCNTPESRGEGVLVIDTNHNCNAPIQTTSLTCNNKKTKENNLTAGNGAR